MTSQPILVAGAGIAGLSLALALASRGIPSRLLERRPQHSEAGAGIQLGPNATHVLTRLGLAARLAPFTARPDCIAVHDGLTGDRLARLALGGAIERRFGSPYLVAHRADLQSALLGAVRDCPLIELVYRFEVSGWRQAGSTLTATAADGRSIDGALLVGADGIWSQVRRALFPAAELTYAGKMAARTLIPAAVAPPRFAQHATGVWLSPDAHVVHYPVRAGREIAVVAVVDEAIPREGWGSAIEATRVLARLIRFSPALVGFLSLATEWRAWSLYDPPSLPAWSKDRVGLIGDAAHPILPFFAQGGGMALEDAETLARLIEAGLSAPQTIFTRFEALRRARLMRVQRASRANGATFHLDGLPALARNTTLRLAPGALIMRRYDWLYGWNGDAI
jgi:salicylate hydroxylase